MSTSLNADRNGQLQTFLERSGWGDATRVSLGEDASTRRYERIYRGEQRAILMDAPPTAESQPCGEDATEQDRIIAGWNGRTRLAACRVDAFVGIADYLLSIGLSAPGVISYDTTNGICLLEDLGDGIYAREIENGADERELYLAATDALAHVHSIPPPLRVPVGDSQWPILHYDRLALTTGADLFPKWYPAYDDSVSMTGADTREYDEICAEISSHLAALPSIFMLRDYHAENLLWLPEREGIKRVGILDFQDAVRGPAAWDLAMFLQDARRDVTPEVQLACFKRYLELTGYEEENFIRDFSMAGAINALRIIGVFARLIKRDGKPRYEAFMSREWNHLIDSLRHPRMRELRRLLVRLVPEIESQF